MAISGMALLLFVLAHLAGNLQIFLGPEKINAYGYFLHSNPGILWNARLGLVVLVILHVWAAISLSRDNRKARPVPYAERKYFAASYASRTMMMSGIIVVVFVIYHLLHFTAQTEAINLTGQNFAGFQDEQGRHDVYRMMIVGFKHPLVSGFYILGMALLAMHISHGASSMFQSLGLRSGAISKTMDSFARALAILIFAGYVAIPIAVLFDLVKLQ